MEVVFEVFSSRQHGEREGENVTEAQFAPWRRLDPCGPPKPPVATAPAGIADRLANRLREPEGKLMAELSSASTPRSCGGRSPLRWKAAMRFPVILAVAAFALAGCNANQAVNPSSQPPSQVFAGHYEDYQPLQSHQLRAEQHRTRRRPLKAGREGRRRRLSLNWRSREMRIPILLTFVALALAGCNANQAINPSGGANLCANDPTCNPYNPSSYAQNNVGIGR